jgi:hypothetical protein
MAGGCTWIGEELIAGHRGPIQMENDLLLMPSQNPDS